MSTQKQQIDVSLMGYFNALAVFVLHDLVTLLRSILDQVWKMSMSLYDPLNYLP